MRKGNTLRKAGRERKGAPWRQGGKVLKSKKADRNF